MTTLALPIRETEYRTYQFYGFPMAILECYSDESEGVAAWIHSNFIQSCFNMEHLESGGSPVPFAPYLYDYGSNPWLTTHRLSRDVFAYMNMSIVEFIIKSLKQNYYCYLNVDEYYIPNRWFYQHQHYSHDILVYGCDEEQEKLLVIGYDEEGTFRKTEVSFAEFTDAYASLDTIENYCHQIYLYQYNPNGHYSFNINLCLDLMEDYLYGRNTSERLYMVAEPYERAYGVDVYEGVQGYLKKLLIGELPFDIRMLYYFWEHKMAMYKRIEYLEQQGFLDPDCEFVQQYAQIEQTALTFRNRMIKASIDHKTERLEQTIEELDDLRREEVAVLERVIAHAREKATLAQNVTV